MNILLCNDDGIHASGISELYSGVRHLGDISVVAPSEERSAVGHAITVFDPLKTWKVEKDDLFSGYAVGGTPADCIKLATTGLLENRPDMVLSGINLGPNTGISVIYSGTVSAATEGTILDIPSIAFSLATYTEPQWTAAAKVAAMVTQEAIKKGIPSQTFLNVNIPNIPLEDIVGFQITRMARSRYNEVFHRREDPRGNAYYWLDGDMEVLENPEGTDVQAVAQHYVSISPIGLDLTRHDMIDQLRSWNF